MKIRKMLLHKEISSVLPLPGATSKDKTKRGRPTGSRSTGSRSTGSRSTGYGPLSTGRQALATLLLLVCLPLLLPGCASDGGEDSRLLVLATNFALYDLCRVYESANVRVEMLAAPGSELHDTEATLRDVAEVTKADILLYAGGESDDWIDEVFASLKTRAPDVGAKKTVRLRAMDLAVTHAEEGNSSKREAEDDGHPGEEDEHVWLSLKNAMAIVRAVGEAIRQCDKTLPAEETDAEDYLRSLESLDGAYRTVIAKAPLSQIVVADRFPFAVLAAEYGLTYEAAFDGCSSNVEIPLFTLNHLIETVEKNRLPAVFYVEFSDGSAAGIVAKETGAMPLLLHSCLNVTAEEWETGVTYLDLMKQNLTNLAFALGAEEESA